jgi:hypothetical protein
MFQKSGLAHIVTGAVLTLGVSALAVDLGKDIMKPMATSLKTVTTGITDGTQNAATLKALADLGAKIDEAITVIPDTDAYKAEVALVGSDAAQSKYQGLLKSLKVNVEELIADVTAAGTKACGDACTTALNQVKQLESLGHGSFKDAN